MFVLKIRWITKYLGKLWNIHTLLPFTQYSFFKGVWNKIFTLKIRIAFRIFDSRSMTIAVPIWGSIWPCCAGSACRCVSQGHLYVFIAFVQCLGQQVPSLLLTPFLCVAWCKPVIYFSVIGVSVVIPPFFLCLLFCF